ncbi:MAG: transglutaminase-like domain-containing protein [Actinobacteria bacterium]|nr:transglutaminase-like domain-containing protein [Actinomycetota bacterium]
MPPFASLAADPTARLDALALALAAELRPVDADAVLARLDELAGEVREVANATGGELAALSFVLGERYGFTGATGEYDHPDHSMLDLVLERRRGLPIALSVIYVATAHRAGIALDGVGLSGHYVVGQFRPASAPVLLDPFGGGRPIVAPNAAEVRPWPPHETTLRMLNNLVGSYTRRNDLGRAIRAAEMRLELSMEPSLREALTAEMRGLRARLN